MIVASMSQIIQLFVLLPVWMTIVVTTTTPMIRVQAQVVSFQCESTNCIDCINEGCGWFPLGGEVSNPGECVTTCSIIADAPCYSEEYYVGQSPVSICNIITQEETDWNICSAVNTGCDDCINTKKSDGISNCVWYDLSSNCGSGTCSLLGCGTSTCTRQGGGGDGGQQSPSSPSIKSPTSSTHTATTKPTNAPIKRTTSTDVENPTLVPVVSDRSPAVDIEPSSTSSSIVPTPPPLDSTSTTSICDRLSTAGCNICISSGCGWIPDSEGGTCIESCTIIADIACYDNTTTPTTTTTSLTTNSSSTDNSDEICFMAETTYNDTLLCNRQASCTDCLSTQLSNNQTCSWYQIDDPNSFATSRCCLFCDVPGTYTEVCSDTDMKRNNTEPSSNSSIVPSSSSVPTTSSTNVPTNTIVPAATTISSVPSTSFVPIVVVESSSKPVSTPNAQTNDTTPTTTRSNDNKNDTTTAAQQRTASSSSSGPVIILSVSFVFVAAATIGSTLLLILI